MSAMASQITGVSIVCSTAGSGADQRKHQNSASLAFVRGIHRWTVNSPHKRPVTRKMLPFDDIIMCSEWASMKHPWALTIGLKYYKLIHWPLGDVAVISKVYDDVIKWKHFPRYWPFMRGIHRSPVNSPNKGQWHRALMFSLICVWTNGWINNRDAGDLRHHRAHYDVIVMDTN